MQADLMGKTVNTVFHPREREKQMQNRIPAHPSENAKVLSGVHEAVVEHVIQSEKRNGDPYVRIVLWLPTQEVHLVTNVYFPKGRALRSQQRLWIFCQILGLEMFDIVEQPELFEIKKLQVQTYQVDTKHSNVCWKYTDVKRFLPALPQGDENVCEEEADKDDVKLLCDPAW